VVPSSTLSYLGDFQLSFRSFFTVTPQNAFSLGCSLTTQPIDARMTSTSSESIASSTQQVEPPQSPQRLLGDPLDSKPSRRFSDSHKCLHGTTGVLADQKRHSHHSAASTSTVAEEGGRGPLANKHSHHGHHANIHTECGRHGDDWLFGGFSVIDTVKRLFERK
jgi:hypothetical protein